MERATMRRQHQMPQDYEPAPLKKRRPKSPPKHIIKQDLSNLQNFFQDQNFIEHLMNNGINSLLPFQQDTFHCITQGNNTIVFQKTGAGKTLAYSLPILRRLNKYKHLDGTIPKVLVVLPTRQLAIQVKDTFQMLANKSCPLKVVAVYGGDPIRDQKERLEQGVDVVVATPGRLIDLINRELMNFKKLKVLVLDEADQMLKQGFKEEVQKIFRAIQKAKQGKQANQEEESHQILLFSVTMSDFLKEINGEYQDHTINFDNEIGITIPKKIKHYKLPLRFGDKTGQIVNKLCDMLTSLHGRSIIFCETKRDVQQLADELGGQTQMLHGHVKQRDRERIYREFKAGKIQRIVATNLAARGLEFPEVELVVQVEPPRCVETYIHRAGRTGRAGKQGICVVLVQKWNQYRINEIERVGKFLFTEICQKDLKSIRE